MRAIIKSKFIIFYLIYLFTPIFSSIIAPFWVIYFYSIGLTSMDIGSLIIFHYFGVLLFEVPTGAIADLLGRKRIVFISYFATGILSILIYLFDNKYILFAIYFLWGITGALKSGSLEAWFTETVVDKEKYVNKWSKIETIRYIGSIIGFLVGSLFASYGNIRKIWLIEGLGFLLISMFIIFLGKETQRYVISPKSYTEYYYKYFNIIKNGIRLIFKKNYLFYFSIVSFFFFGSSGIISLLWQPFLVKNLFLSERYLGLIMCITLISSLIGARFSALLYKFCKDEINALLIVIMSISATIIFMGIFSINYIFIFFFAFYMFLYGFWNPLSQGFMNKFIPDELRATILSNFNLLIGLATIFGSILFGLHDKIGAHKLLFISSILNFGGFAVLYKINKLRWVKVK